MLEASKTTPALAGFGCATRDRYSPEQQANMFNVRSQADSSTSRRFQGAPGLV